MASSWGHLVQREFWSKLLNTPAKGPDAISGRDRFTLELLRNQYDVLLKNPVVHEGNKALVVETIRSIAEFMIWGDQNEPRVFDFFLENNVMQIIHQVLLQPSNRSGDVAKQVLQTLSIIIQNISSETGTYFLFSNNHVNNILEISFDFEDEEVLGFYISFLKAISLKLNHKTSQFFVRVDEQDGTLSFPLYSAAIKFAHHKEGMVRAGVRTMTLNIFSLSDPYIDTIITAPSAAHYLGDVASYLARHIRILDQRMMGAEAFGPQALSSLDSQLAEVEDIISYSSDVLSAGHPYLAHLLAQQLWTSVVGPLLLAPLLDQPDEALLKASGSHAVTIRPACALYVLERIFQMVSYKPLINNLLLALFARYSPVLQPPEGSATDVRRAGSLSALVETAVEPFIAEGSATHYGTCRDGIVGALRHSTPHTASNAIRMLVAVAKCHSASPEVLYGLSLLPFPASTSFADLCKGSPACVICQLLEALAAEQQGEAMGVAAKAHAGRLVFAYAMVWTSYVLPAVPAPLEPQHEEAAAPIDDQVGEQAAPDMMPDTQQEVQQEQQQQLSEAAQQQMDTIYQEVLQGAAGAQAEETLLIDLDDSLSDSMGSAAARPHGAPLNLAEQASMSLQDKPAGGMPGEVSQGMPDLSRLDISHDADLRKRTEEAAGRPDEQLVDMLTEPSVSRLSPSAPDMASGLAVPMGSEAIADMHGDEPATASHAQELQQVAHLLASPPPPPPAPPAPSPPPPPLLQPSHPIDEPDLLGLDEDLGPADSSHEQQQQPEASHEHGGGEEQHEGQHAASHASQGGMHEAAVQPDLSGESELAVGANGGDECTTGDKGDLADEQANAERMLHLQQSTSLSSNYNLLGLEEQVSEEDSQVRDQEQQQPEQEQQEQQEQQLHDGEEQQTTSPKSIELESEAMLSTCFQHPLGSPRPSPTAVVVHPLASPQRQPSTQCSHHPLIPPPATDLLDALFSLLAAPLLPVPSLWNAIFLISQYCPAPMGSTTTSPAMATSPRTAPAGRGGKPLRVTEQQQESLQSAFDEVVARVHDELDGMWSDAIFPLICTDWSAAAESVCRPILRASADVLVAGPSLYPPRPEATDDTAAPGSRQQAVAAATAVAQMMGLSSSAAAALHAVHAVQRLVALLQLRQLLQEGYISKQAPVPTLPDWELRSHDVTEGQQVELQAATAIPCMVSFTPGQERRVYFSVSGEALLRAHDYTNSSEAVMDDPEAVACVLHSSPAVVLADPAPTRLNAGIVASMSPLMGADPAVDKNVAKWLHIHVRPSVRGLLRVLRAAPSKKGGIVAAMRPLADGHWVLAFPDSTRSAAACDLVHQHTALLRSMYKELLGRLISADLAAGLLV